MRKTIGASPESAQFAFDPARDLAGLVPGQRLAFAPEMEYKDTIPGGFAVVHKVYDHQDKRFFAIKVPKAALWNNLAVLRGFREEVANYIRLGMHPSIVSAVQSFEINGVPYLMTEFIEGRSLRSCMPLIGTGGSEQRKDFQANPAVIGWIALHIARGIAHAHDRGITHGDVKPENVIVAEGSYQAKLIDFGLGGEARRAIGGGFAGTLEYSAPEFLSGQSPAPLLGDVYSFGVLLFEMLENRLPHFFANADDWRRVELRSRPQMSTRWDARIRSLVYGCLEPHPQDRMSSFRDIVRQLEDIWPQYIGSEAHRNEFDQKLDRALMLYSSGSYGEAVVAYQECSQYSPDDKTFMDQWAGALKGLGRLDEALEKSEEGLKVIGLDRNERKWRLNRKAMILSDMKKPQEAIARYLEALNLGEEGTLRSNLAFEYDRIGEFGKAEESYLRAQAAETADGSYCNFLGNFYYRNTLYGESLESYHHAIERNPREALSYTNMAGTLDEVGDYDPIPEILSRGLAQAVDRVPLYGRYLDHCAEWNMELGQRVCLDALNQLPDSPELNAKIRQVFRYDRDFLRMLGLSDQTRATRTGQSTASGVESPIQAAAEVTRRIKEGEFEKARSLIANLPIGVMRAAGEAEFNEATGDSEEALAAYRRALDIDPYDTALIEAEIRLLLELDRPDAAVQRAEFQASRFPRAVLHLNQVGVALHNHKDPSIRLQYYRAAGQNAGRPGMYWLNAARCYVQMGRFAEVEVVADILRDDKWGAWYWMRCIADACMDADHLGRANEYLTVALDFGGREKYLCLKDMLRLALLMQDSAKERDALAVLADRYVARPEVVNRLGVVYLNAGRTQQAIEYFERAAQNNRRQPLFWSNLGIARKKAQDHSGARTAFERATELDDRDFGSWNEIGLTFYQTESWAEALAAFGKACDLRPENADLWNNLGSTQRNLKNWPGAQAAHERAVALNPGNRGFRFNLGVAYSGLPETRPKAVKAFQAVLRLGEKDAEAWRSLGHVHGHLNEWEAARDAYQRASEIDTGNAEGWFWLGVSLDKLQFSAEARTAFQKACDIEPGNAEFSRQHGLVCFNRGDLVAAGAAFRTVLGIDGSSAADWSLMSVIHRNQGEHGAALMAAARALRIEPHGALHWNNAGLAYLGLQKHGKAARAIRKAIARDPENSAFWNNLAEIFRSCGELDSAIEAATKAIDLNRKNAAAWNIIGIIHYKREQWVKARGSFVNAVRAAPKDGQIWNNLGDARKKMGRLGSAVRAYKRATELEPGNAIFWYDLGDAYFGLEDWPNAGDAYAKATEIKPDHAKYWNDLAVTLAHCGKHGEALGCAVRAVELAPDNALYRQNLQQTERQNLSLLVDEWPGAPTIDGALAFLKGNGEGPDSGLPGPEPSVTLDLVAEFAENAAAPARYERFGQHFYTQVLCAAVEFGNAAAVGHLLDVGADAGACLGPWPLLMSAASAGNLQICQLLVAAGAEVNGTNEIGMTALMVAVDQGHKDIVEYLIKNGADVNADCPVASPMLLALYSGNSDLAQILLAAGAKKLTEDEVAARVSQAFSPEGAQRLAQTARRRRPKKRKKDSKP